MKASTYNFVEIQEGRLTPEMITKLVEDWQRHHDLAVDGFGGPQTQESIQKALSGGKRPIRKVYPLIVLPDGRQPVITSGFHTENPSRSTHNGVDFFYPWTDDDPDVPVGDGGAIKRNGKRRWWYPPLKYCDRAKAAISAAEGIVTAAGETKTGWRTWVDHGNGERTGYFHLEQIFVAEGAHVEAGAALGIVGDNPRGHDGEHLHFEVSSVGAYRPKNPRTWLEDATYITARS